MNRDLPTFCLSVSACAVLAAASSRQARPAKATAKSVYLRVCMMLPHPSFSALTCGRRPPPHPSCEPSAPPDFRGAPCVWVLLAPSDQANRETTTTSAAGCIPISYTHLRAHETRHDLVCRLLL